MKASQFSLVVYQHLPIALGCHHILHFYSVFCNVEKDAKAMLKVSLSNVLAVKGVNGISMLRDSLIIFPLQCPHTLQTLISVK